MIYKKTCWIVFKPGTHLLSNILKKDYAHVYLLYKDKYNWIKVDPSQSSLDVTILPVPASKNIIDIFSKVDSVTSIVKISTTIHKNKVINYNPFNIINCVNVVKYYCGIQSWVCTPYQLYKLFCKLSCTNNTKYGIDNVVLIKM